ncbi:tRNA:m(4)X modification enzyme TRM13 homolog isoform X2 [Leptopilina boulardi]|nr:tRNA:m(4)X modification enzyme TRM13 homolog isoform X2 [Leptopilina boulardi]
MEDKHCQYFVKRKKRYCRMTVKKNNQFCGEHQPNQNEIVQDLSKKRRIVCPLDSKHTCYENKLAKHLKVCNAKVKVDSLPAYIIKGINLGDIDLKQPTHIRLSLIDSSIVNTVIDKINSAYVHLPKISEIILSHDVLTEELNNPTYGHGAKRHLLQTASLLGHLENSKLIQNNTCFIEFGAGKGKLTYWLAQVIKGQSESSLLLVDRSSHRHKKDNKLKNEDNPLNVKRIRVDIADLKLNKVEDIGENCSIVGVAKHLCGSATDLTLRCLISAKEDDKSIRKISGLIIAFCCHHRCEYSSYVGKKYLESCNFSADEFPILCSIASWATCGFEKNAKINNHEDTIEQQEKLENDLKTFKEREEMGRKVKMLLNWGRVEYLKNSGFNCQLIYYTSVDFSLENVCIIAKLCN